MKNLQVGFSNGINKTNADMNGDGKITSVDLSKLNAIANGTRCSSSLSNSNSSGISVGKVVANLNSACYKAPKNGFSKGQCTWYAKGRYCEVRGKVLDFPSGSHAKYWGTKVKQRNSVSVDGNVSSKSIGIRQSGGGGYGHVIFIEQVNGNTVYYTDANNGATAGKVRIMNKSELLSNYKQFIH